MGPMNETAEFVPFVIPFDGNKFSNFEVRNARCDVDIVSHQNRFPLPTSFQHVYDKSLVPQADKVIRQYSMDFALY